MNKFLPIIMSGILALPTMAFAASSVRTLGGAGTYNGVTSVGSGTAARAGSIRAVPSVKVPKTTSSTSGSTGTVSGNTGAGTRMSIGKYLSGSGVVSTKVSSSAGTTELADDISNLTINIDELAQRLKMLEDADYITVADLSDDNLSEDYLTKNEIEALLYIDVTELDKALTDLKLEEYAKKTDILSQENVSQIIADAITDPNTGVLKNYATNDELDALSISAGEWIDEAVGDAKKALNARIDKVEAGLSSFEIYDRPFDPDKLDVE